MTLSGLLLSLRRGDFVDKKTGEHIQFCHLKFARPSDDSELIGLEDEKVKVPFDQFEKFKVMCQSLIGRQVEIDVDIRIKGKFVQLTALSVRQPVSAVRAAA